MMRQTRVPIKAHGSAEDPALRYVLAGHKIGVTTLAEYLRLLHGAATWMIVPPLLGRLLGRLDARGALHRLERWWARGVLRHLKIDLDISGMEHVDPDQSYVVVALHEGFADVLALLRLPLDLRFVARDELFEWRRLGPYLRDTRQISVAPEHGRRSYRAIRRAADAVFAAGESLVVFPQGTILGIETDFMGGAFALARAVRRPLLCIALTGSHRVWEHPYTPRLRYGQRMSMRILPPITPEDYAQQSTDELRVEVRRSLKALALSGEMAAPRHFVPERDGYWDGYAYRIDPDFPALADKIARRRSERHGERVSADDSAQKGLLD